METDFAFDLAEMASFVSRDNVAMDLIQWQLDGELIKFIMKVLHLVSQKILKVMSEFGNDEWFYDTSIEYSKDKWYAYVQGNSRSGGVINKFQQYDDEYLDYEGNPIKIQRLYSMEWWSRLQSFR